MNHTSQDTVKPTFSVIQNSGHLNGESSVLEKCQDKEGDCVQEAHFVRGNAAETLVTTSQGSSTDAETWIGVIFCFVII